jgi:hypothetical protein
VNLLDLLSAEVRPEAGVPAWALGCFRRRSITYFDAFADTATQVLWLQSWGLTFDLRLAAARPRVADSGALAAAPPDDAVALAEAEGGIARTSAEVLPGVPCQGRFSWHDWDSVQPYAKWPEPGVCRRVGDCLIEFAPSGAYVEDWRYQDAGPGPLIGLRLLEERDRDSGALLHRGGGLVICGRHAGFVRGRARPLPEGSRAADLVRAAPRDRELLATVFGCEASYGTAAGGAAFVVAASTLPWREGEPLLSLEGFDRTGDGTLIQRASEQGKNLERSFRVDTLAARFPELAITPVTPEGAAWLDAERATLQR